MIKAGTKTQFHRSKGEFFMEPAGFWIRLAANIIDSLLVGIPLAIISLLLGLADDNIAINTVAFMYGLLLPVVWSGYTVGKKIVGIKIKKVDGSDLGLGAMFMRVVVAGIVFGVTLGIGVVVSAFMVGLRQDKRGLHDFMAGTQVVYDSR